MKLDKDQIIKYAGASLITLGLAIGVTGIYIENTIDHTEDYCPLCDAFSIEYQINVVKNNDVSYKKVSNNINEDEILYKNGPICYVKSSKNEILNELSGAKRK